MHKLIPLFAILAAIMCGCSTANSKVIRPVAPFNAAEFCGVWYKTAGYPADEYSETQIHLSCMPNGKISCVISSEYDGSTVSESGNIKFDNPEIGQFRISTSPVSDDECCVVFVDDNYRECIVYNQSGDKLWIMTRNPENSSGIPKHLLKIAAEFAPENEIKIVGQQKNTRKYNAIFGQDQPYDR